MKRRQGDRRRSPKRNGAAGTGNDEPTDERRRSMESAVVLSYLARDRQRELARARGQRNWIAMFRKDRAA
jgi:hypothetical protein